MKAFFLGVALVMGLGGAVLAKEQCYGRNYTEAHLALHPHQLVTNVLLRIYDEPTFTPPIGWDIRINRRGRGEAEYASGLCRNNKRGGKIDLECFIECDGGSFEVDFQDASSLLLHLDSIAVNSSCGGDSETDTETVSSGVDDKVFRLKRLPASACHEFEAVNLSPVIAPPGETLPPLTDPDSWVIVKRHSDQECHVISGKPGEKDVEVVSTFKGFIADERKRQTIVKYCGCGSGGCSWVLPK